MEYPKPDGYGLESQSGYVSVMWRKLDRLRTDSSPRLDSPIEVEGSVHPLVGFAADVVNSTDDEVQYLETRA